MGEYPLLCNYGRKGGINTASIFSAYLRFFQPGQYWMKPLLRFFHIVRFTVVAPESGKLERIVDFLPE